MQWTVRLEARTSQGEATTTELLTFSRPAVVSTLAEVGPVSCSSCHHAFVPKGGIVWLPS